MPRALIVGGTGLIGRATAGRLLAAGWEVDLTGRNPAHLPADIAAAGAKFVVADRDDPAQLLAALPRQLDHVWDEVLLDDDGADETLGRHPWDVPHPVVLDMKPPSIWDICRSATTRRRWSMRSTGSSPRPAAVTARTFFPVSTTPSSRRCLTTPPRTAGEQVAFEVSQGLSTDAAREVLWH